MKVLVTGGAGYIGSVLVPRLISLGHNVRVLDTLWFGSTLPKECEVITGNICKFEDKWLDGIEAVVHLAATSNDPMAEFDPFVNYVINASATAMLVEKFRAKNINKVVVASSCSVYGFAHDRTFTESEPSTPTFPYGISKLMSEKAIACLTDYRFNPVILRKGTIGGYSPRMRFDLVVNTMTKFALTRGKITVNNPNLWRPIVDVRDVAEAYVCALNKDTGGAFNIIEGNYTILEIANQVADALEKLGKTKPQIDVLNIEDLRSYKASAERAEYVLGFKAKYKVFDTVKSIVDHIDSGEIPNFTDKKYYNIEVFKSVIKDVFN